MIGGLIMMCIGHAFGVPEHVPKPKRKPWSYLGTILLYPLDFLDRRDLWTSTGFRFYAIGKMLFNLGILVGGIGSLINLTEDIF